MSWIKKIPIAGVTMGIYWEDKLSREYRLSRIGYQRLS